RRGRTGPKPDDAAHGAMALAVIERRLVGSPFRRGLFAAAFLAARLFRTRLFAHEFLATSVFPFFVATSCGLLWWGQRVRFPPAERAPCGSTKIDRHSG